MGKCFSCSNPVTGGPKDVQFEYRDQSFSVYISGNECPDCAENKQRDLYDLYQAELFQSGPGPVKVNWAHYRQTSHTYGYDDTLKDFHLLLMGLGILSAEITGNWAIYAPGEICLNPSVYGLRLFFTSREEVLDYCWVVLATTQYSWSIRHIDVVISSSVVLRPQVVG